MKVRGVIYVVIVLGLCIALSVVVLRDVRIEINKIELPWIAGTFMAIAAVATSVVAYLAWRSNRTANRAIARTEEQDKIRSGHAIFQIERQAIELVDALSRLAQEGHDQGAKKGLPDNQTFRVKTPLSDEVKDKSRSFLDLFQIVGASILNEQRHNEIRLAAAQLTRLLKHPDPHVKDIEEALNTVTDVLHVEDTRDKGAGED